MILLLLIVGVSWFTETNSHAASARGTRAYQKQQYAEAVRAFQRAQDLKASPRGAFNLGTAQIANGQREQGSSTLTAAMKDPSLRADALFNRGNSALASKAFDHAIGDYIETLRLRPSHAGAKRNLEIALARREASRSGSSGEHQNKAGKNQQQQKPQPSAGGQQKPQGQPDLEALLRSVQQQEQEELRRMKAKAASEGRVGW
jgi:Ca-activated chloride channel family protein